MLVFALVYITLCPFEFCNHLDEKEKELVVLCLDTINVMWLFLTVPKVGL